MSLEGVGILSFLLGASLIGLIIIGVRWFIKLIKEQNEENKKLHEFLKKSMGDKNYLKYLEIIDITGVIDPR